MNRTVTLFFLLFFCTITQAENAQTMPTDFDIQITSFVPKEKSIVKVDTPITVHYSYNYSYPDENLYIWMIPKSKKFQSTLYQGSPLDLSPGHGEGKRFFKMSSSGTVDQINILVKNKNFEEIFNQYIDVKFTYLEKGDYPEPESYGIGSQITYAELTTPLPATLIIGSKATINVQYHINLDQGLRIQATPVTNCKTTLQHPDKIYFGKGTAQIQFTIEESCEINRVKLSMKNSSNTEVFEGYIDTDITYTRP